MGVFVGVSAVYHVVAGHDGFGLALGDGHFKGSQVDFPKGPLVHHGIHAHPPQLLGVDGKVLGAGGNTVCLDAPDVGRAHFSRQIGVLGEILKVPAAQGRALHVQAGAEDHVHVIGSGFLSQGTAQLLAQRNIPGVCHGGGGGEAGGGHRGVQAQVVPRSRLLAQAVRSVGQENGRDAQLVSVPGGPGAPALKQSSLLFQCELADVRFHIHGNLSFFAVILFRCQP